MVEHCDKPIAQIAFAYVGDTRNNVSNSLLVGGAFWVWMCVCVGPKELWPADESSRIVPTTSRSTAPMTITDDPQAAVEGVDFIHTDVWVSMGEPKQVGRSGST